MAKMKYKKVFKLSSNLAVGDNIRVAGLLCEVEKTEEVFHQVEAGNLRISLKVVGSTKQKSKMIMFMNPSLPVTVLE